MKQLKSFRLSIQQKIIVLLLLELFLCGGSFFAGQPCSAVTAYAAQMDDNVPLYTDTEPGAETVGWPPDPSLKYWDSGHEIVCKEQRTGCSLLQMVMTGSFGSFDPDDSVSGRVFSLVFPQLCAVTEDDIDHFLGEYGEEGFLSELPDDGSRKEAVLGRLYLAIANCLWADILWESIPEESMNAERLVLLLFLDPSSQENGPEQIAEIRSELTEKTIGILAEGSGVPAGFVKWLTDCPS